MKHVKVVCFLILGAILLTTGCTRDDICDPAMAVTPLLIITFKDNANVTQAKSVTGLSVRKNDVDSTLVFRTTEATDSIAIPLDTETDITELLFILNDDDNEETTNGDRLNFTYQREETYVNRACGFKTTYSEFDTELLDDTDNWITSFLLLQTTITDETEAHLTIRF